MSLKSSSFLSAWLVIYMRLLPSFETSERVTLFMAKISSVSNESRAYVGENKNTKSRKTVLFNLIIITPKYNLLIMCLLFPLGIIAISNFVIIPFDKFQILLFQIIVILIFDDFYFYWFHRLMHSNKFFFEKVHIIHHKASNPFPADYLYEHPVEWIIGLLGPFIGILIIGEVYFETIVLYLIIRILHELDIHSGLKSSIYRYFPFAGVNEYHALHHKHHVKHFASLFSFWDIIFKTHSKY